MQDQQLMTKLSQLFPNQIPNFGISQSCSRLIDNFESLSFLISSSLPQLSIGQINTLCRRQQKNVLDRILSLKNIDLYAQIESVCPSQQGLRDMPLEEVTSRINEMTTKMAQQKGMQNESDKEMESCSERDSKLSDGSDEMIQPMEIDEMDYEPVDQAKGLENIFEEEFNTHLRWNEMCIYDLN